VWPHGGEYKVKAHLPGTAHQDFEWFRRHVDGFVQVGVLDTAWKMRRIKRCERESYILNTHTSKPTSSIRSGKPRAAQPGTWVSDR
jgi:hypothetical protein